jgi:hypothetical protein
MKKIISCIFIFSLLFCELKAQARSYEDSPLPGKTWIVLAAGPAYILTGYAYDGTKLTNNKTVSLGFRHLFPTNVGYKAALHYGLFAGSDSISNQYTSIIYEGTFQAEYILLGGPFSSTPNKNTLSIFAGVGYVYNVSKSTGDTITYKKYFPDLFTGIGYQRNITNRITLGLNLSIKYLFSPYILGEPSFAHQGVTVDKSGRSDTYTRGLKDNIIPSLEISLTYNVDKARKNKKGCNCDWDWGN